MNKVFKFLFNKKTRFNYLSSKGFYNNMSDERYIKKMYKTLTSKKLNLEKPHTFNEKIQWLKLHDRKKIYTTMVDKYEAKKYVANIIGDEYIIPAIGIYNSFEEINFDELPNQFVIKCTHDSGGLVICRDKKKLDIDMARKKINKSLKNNYYYHAREWPYKNVKPRIIVEEYKEDSKNKELRDYKFFCFNGVPKMMFIATDRGIHQTKFNFYDLDFKLLPFTQHYPNDKRNIEKPQKFEEMLELSKKLSKNIPFIRVDFYEVDGKVYFGELTFSHFSGMMPFDPPEWDEKLGSLIDLSVVDSK